MNKFKKTIDNIEFKSEDKKRILNNILIEKDKRERKRVSSLVLKFATFVLAFLLVSTTCFALVKIFNIDDKFQNYFGKSSEEFEEYGVGGTDVDLTKEFDDATVTINQTIVDEKELFISLDILGKEEAIYIDAAYLTQGVEFDESTLYSGIITDTGKEYIDFKCNEGDIFGCSSYGFIVLEENGLTTGYTINISIDGNIKEQEDVTLRLIADNKNYDITFTLSKNDMKTIGKEFDTIIYNENDIVVKVTNIRISPLYVMVDLESNIDLNDLTADEEMLLDDAVYNENSMNHTYVTYKDGSTTTLRLWNHGKNGRTNPYGVHGTKEDQVNNIDNIESITINNVKFDIN